MRMHEHHTTSTGMSCPNCRGSPHIIALWDFIADTGMDTQPGAPNLLDDGMHTAVPDLHADVDLSAAPSMRGASLDDDLELHEVALGRTTPLESQSAVGSETSSTFVVFVSDYAPVTNSLTLLMATFFDSMF